MPSLSFDLSDLDPTGDLSLSRSDIVNRGIQFARKHYHDASTSTLTLDLDLHGDKRRTMGGPEEELENAGASGRSNLGTAGERSEADAGAEAEAETHGVGAEGFGAVTEKSVEDLDSNLRAEEEEEEAESETSRIGDIPVSKIKALSLPNGCGSLPPELLPLLAPFKRIYLWMDNDGPGIAAAEKFANKLGKHRCHIVRPLQVKRGIQRSVALFALFALFA